MPSPSICCVVPTNRPERLAEFGAAWQPLFERHNVTLIVVRDGGDPQVEIHTPRQSVVLWDKSEVWAKHRHLFCRYSDVIRNLGFVCAAQLGFEYIITLDDDVAPRIPNGFNDGAINDPIKSHLLALGVKCPISWMNTAGTLSIEDGPLYLRGVPYSVRDEAPVKLSHGVWWGVPDFDGETQLKLEGTIGVPETLFYHVGPVPRGVKMALCGMNVTVHRDALPYFYFAPMGPDCGVAGLHRFGDILMGVCLKQRFDELGWAVYTGASIVHHTRASDAKKNMEQERLGREWNEWFWTLPEFMHFPPPTPDLQVVTDASRYFASYAAKREEFADLITSYQKGYSHARRHDNPS